MRESVCRNCLIEIVLFDGSIHPLSNCHFGEVVHIRLCVLMGSNWRSLKSFSQFAVIALISGLKFLSGGSNIN